MKTENFEKLKVKSWKSKNVKKLKVAPWKYAKPSLRTTEDTHSGDEIGSKDEYQRKLGKNKKILNM